jgi:hypothetical protein
MAQEYIDLSSETWESSLDQDCMELGIVWLAYFVFLASLKFVVLLHLSYKFSSHVHTRTYFSPKMF